MARLADLVQLPELALRPVPHTDLDRPVRWVTTSELPDPTPYLDGAELLLTTGLVEQDWVGYIDRIVAASVAALGFGVGVCHPAIPDTLLQAARHRHLPLVEVPESTPFIAIGKALVRRIAEEEQTATATALRLQQELTRAISRKNGTARTLRILDRATGGQASLVRASDRAAGTRCFQPDAVAAVRAVQQRASQDAVTVINGSGTTVVQRVGASGSGPVLVLQVPGPLTDVGRATLATTAALLGLDDERRRAAIDADLRLRDCATRLLLAGSVDASRAVAELLDPAPRSPNRLRVVEAAGAAPGTRERLAHEHADALTMDDGEGRVTVLAEPGSVPHIEVLLAEAGCLAGVGSLVDPGHAVDSRAAARTALAAAGPAEPVVRWDEHFRSSVVGVLPTGAAQAVAVGVLGGLRDRPELLATLRCYLEHLGRWQPTAAALGVHRNTLGKRLRRIQEVTGRDVDTAAGRADLWIALEATEPAHVR